MTYLRRYTYLLGVMIGLLSVAGCATVKRPPVSILPEQSTVQVKSVQHKVHKGETLWRIARTYGVSMDEIIRANNIPNAASIEDGQLIQIPGVDSLREIPSAPDQAENDNDFIWPLRGKVISYYHEQKGATYNRGIDIKVSDEEYVKASRSGKVVLSDRIPGYGYTVILDHLDGFYTVYAHNEKIFVALNDYVLRGDKVGMPAQSGGKIYEHFEIRKGDVAGNPLYYLP